jgi:8-oxo-dGTP pyrophosphatase MutT (NUDIX family)
MIEKREIANYHVGQKALLKKGDEYLVLISPNGLYDWPGGRIDTVEDTLPLPEILDREIKEELGNDVQYELGRVVMQSRRFWKGIRVFLSFFEAEYLGGEIQLSDEHGEFKWMAAKQILAKPELFMSPEERDTFTSYFQQIG